jgi:hypothetical protein
MKTTLKVNASYKNKMQQIEQLAEDAVKDRLVEIAQTAVRHSPVDTGAYVTSFSYSVGAGRPRGKSSANKPRNQNPNSKRDEGLANLMSDITKLGELKGTTRITLRNAAPHAEAVETKHGYSVFAKLRNLYG